MHKVGVVLATYNGEKYISTQLKSIINQTIKPDLIVVSDANSNDNTVKICKDILSKSNIQHVILTNKINLNVQSNFEKGLEECSAEYIFFSDQDDFWNENKIQITLENMIATNAVLAFTNAEIVNKDLNTIGLDLWKKIGYIPNNYLNMYKVNDFNFIFRLLKSNIATGMTFCIKNDIRNFILPFSQNCLHDIWIILISSCLGTVISIDEKSVLYRQHSSNTVGARRKLKNTFRNGKEYRKTISRRFNMIDDLIIRIESFSSTEIIFLLKDYKKYLLKRNSFINNNLSFFEFLKSQGYKIYELNPIQIIIRDLIAYLGFF